jgi:hypothetical protein
VPIEIHPPAGNIGRRASMISVFNGTRISSSGGSYESTIPNPTSIG